MNLVSARNVISMAVSDGVPYFILLSAASNPPGASREYLRSKREAEEYLRNSGLRYAVVRAPVLFDREQPSGAFFAALSRIGALPFLRVFFGRRAPGLSLSSFSFISLIPPSFKTQYSGIFAVQCPQKPQR